MMSVHISALYEAAQLNTNVVHFPISFKLGNVDSRANANFCILTTCTVKDGDIEYKSQNP